MASKSERTAIEESIQSLAVAGTYEDAIHAAIDGYGGELLGFLVKMTGSDAAGQDAFQDLCIMLWEQLPDFRWQSTFRTWAYRVARGAIRDQTSNREVRLNTHAAAALRADDLTRTATLAFRKTESRDELRAALAELSASDREIVVLRIYDRMSWKDIARVVSDEPDLEADELTRQAASLRKKFERAKAQLRELMGED